MKFTHLELDTYDLKAMKQFYKDTLNFPLLDANNDRLLFNAGATQLSFKKTTFDKARHYHFAFNIPENQIHEAHQWLKKRVKIETYEGLDIVDFSNWNAHALYFYDPMGNIVELIARHDLPNASDVEFSAKSITRISEIGLPTLDLVDFKAVLDKGNMDLPIYKSSHAKFQPMGDEYGLFINVPIGRTWFMTDNVQAAEFGTEVFVDKPKGLDFEYGAYRIKS